MCIGCGEARLDIILIGDEGLPLCYDCIEVIHEIVQAVVFSENSSDLDADWDHRAEGS